MVAHQTAPVYFWATPPTLYLQESMEPRSVAALRIWPLGQALQSVAAAQTWLRGSGRHLEVEQPMRQRLLIHDFWRESE